MEVFLTYHSLGRVAPAILTAIIAAYLLVRRRKERAARWLGLYFAFLTVFNCGYVLGYSLNAPAGALGWYLACAVAFAGAARLQFAYVFPTAVFERERRAALGIAFFAAALALLDYAVRVDRPFFLGYALHAYGSRYSSLWIPLVSFVCFFFSVVVAFRKVRLILVGASGRGSGRGARGAGWRKLWKSNPDLRTLSYLIGITVLEVAINGVYFLGYSRIIGNQSLAWLMNVSTLVIFSAYIIVYSAAPSGRISFMPRLVGASLVALLALLTFAGLAGRERELQNFAAEKRAAALLRLSHASQADSPPSDSPAAAVRFILAQDGGPDLSASFGAEALRAALAARRSDGVNEFTRVGDASFYLIDLQQAGRSYTAGFEYREYRERVHQAVAPICLALLVAAGLSLAALPLLFRASLILPLRFLLEDLGRLQAAPARRGGDDEISVLRESFHKMAELLREARREMPDFSPHIVELEKFSEAETGVIVLGDRTLVYRSRALRAVIAAVERARAFRHPVLITGETGSGKELIARLVHGGDAEAGPFVAVNCAALPEALWESEIFGHRKGAFTDARSDRRGRLLEAARGAVFFDEIGEMPLSIQAKLLRLLQDNQFTPVGADAPIAAECRFVFATNRDLAAMVREKTFREDLLYRIRVFHIEAPPLRDRPEDIPDLLRYFVERFAAEYNLPAPETDGALLQALLRYRWPGNIREMENAVVRAMAHGPGDVLSLSHFPEIARSLRADAGGTAAGGDAFERLDFDLEVKRYSRALLERALGAAGGNKTRAAELLGLKRTTLRYRLKELGIDPDS